MAEFEQKEVTIGETKYTLQKLPIRKAMEIRREWTDRDGNLNDIKMFEKMLEYIVVSPKKKLDDFDDYTELSLLGSEVLNFQFGGKYVQKIADFRY